MQVVQTKLRKDTEEMIVFLPVDKRVKPGKRISLQTIDGIWTVIDQYETIDHTDIKRGWDNNY